MIGPSSDSPGNDDRWKQFGFLIADLFMVLMLLFLIIALSARAEASRLSAQVNDLDSKVATITPAMATLTAENATLATRVACVPRLATSAVVLSLNVDWQGLLNGASSAAVDVVNQVRAHKELQGRRAGVDQRQHVVA